MLYDILIDYTTGDSFRSERITGESVGIVTTDVEKAKENLKRIKEHYLAHQDGLDYSETRYNLVLLTDEGERSISPFWMGYFETLHGARIQAEDSDMGFTF